MRAAAAARARAAEIRARGYASSVRANELGSGGEAGARGEAELRDPADAGGTVVESPPPQAAEEVFEERATAQGERELAEEGPNRWAGTEDGGSTAAGRAADIGRRRPVASRLRRLFGPLEGRPRLRVATLCLLGLLSGGLAGASLAALHLALFGPDPVLSEAEPAAAAPVRAPASAPAVQSGPKDAFELRPAQMAEGSAAEPVPAVGEDDATAAAVADTDDIAPPERAAAVLTPSRPLIPEPARSPSVKPEVIAMPAAKPHVASPGPAKPAPGAGAGEPAPPAPSPPPPRHGVALAEPAAGEGGAAEWKTLYKLAHRLQADGDPERAIAAFGRAAAADPSHAATFYDWGYALQKAGRPEAAIEKYRRALELEPDHAYAHYNLGYLLQQKGDLAGASASYREAAALDDGNPYVFYNWGEILRRQGDIEGAIALYRRAVRLAPDRQPGLDARARLQQLEKQGSG